MAERLYTVTSQVPTRQFIGGALTDVYEIHYSGPNGVQGMVRVPVATATPEQVDTLIQRQLETQLQISQLGEQ